MSRVFQLALCATLIGSPVCLSRAAPVASIENKKATFVATLQTADGQPIAGATALAWMYADDGRKLFFSVQSDAQGRLKVEAPASKKWDERFGIQAVVHAPGYAWEAIGLGQSDAFFRLVPQTVALSGRVVDENGAPIAGATVQLAQLNLPLSDERPTQMSADVRLQDVPDELSKILQTQSDADGNWTLPDLPARTQVSVELNDARYQRVSGIVPVGTGATAQLAAPLIAQAGARLSGRVLAPDGTPQVGAGVSVRVEGAKGEAARNATATAADGTYAMHGLAAGAATITVAPHSLDAVPLQLNGVQLQTDQSARVPDARLNGGVLLSGLVTDVATREPIAGVEIGAAGPGGFSTGSSSDEKGRYTIRVAPAETYFYLYRVPGGYLTNGATTDKAPIAASDKKAPDFALKRGLTLRGTALDEAGQPVKGAFIYTGTEFSGTMGFPDKNGEWKIEGIDPDQQVRGQVRGVGRGGRANSKPGELRVKVGGSWALVEEVSLPGDALDEAARQPIELRLRRIELQDVIVRVVDDAGAPLAGVNVNIEITDEASQDSFGYGATTAADGAVTVQRLRPDQSAKVTPFLRGYQLKSAGTVTALAAATDKTRATDAVMVAPTRTLQGRVLDAAGAPVVGAQVAALAPGDARDVELFARTDAAGRFRLGGLRPGQITIGAAQEQSFGRATVAADAREIEITFAQTSPQPPPRDRAGARAVLQRWLAQTGENSDVQLVSLAASLAATDPDALDLAAMLSRSDRATFDKSLARLRDIYALPGGANETRIEQRRALEEIQTLLTTDRDAALRLYNEVAANLPETPPTRGEREERTRRDATLWGIARNLGHADAEFWRDALERDLAQEVREVALRNARNNNDPFFKVSGRSKSDLAFIIARADVAAALEFAAELDLADRLRALHRIVPLVVARDLSKDEALKLLRVSHDEARQSSVSSGAELAALAAPLDAKLSESWFAEARRELAKPAPAGDERFRVGAASYAFYRAPLDAAHSRLLLESEWLRVGEINSDFNVNAAVNVAWAMAPLDFERALEILDQLQARGDQVHRERSVRHHLLAWLLASENERATLDFWYPHSADLPE